MELLTSTSAEQFQQCAEFLPFRNRALGEFRDHRAGKAKMIRSRRWIMSDAGLSTRRACGADPASSPAPTPRYR
jgi:hypothetical protein